LATRLGNAVFHRNLELLEAAVTAVSMKSRYCYGY